MFRFSVFFILFYAQLLNADTTITLENTSETIEDVTDDNYKEISIFANSLQQSQLTINDSDIKFIIDGIIKMEGYCRDQNDTCLATGKVVLTMDNSNLELISNTDAQNLPSIAIRQHTEVNLANSKMVVSLVRNLTNEEIGQDEFGASSFTINAENSDFLSNKIELDATTRLTLRFEGKSDTETNRFSLTGIRDSENIPIAIEAQEISIMSFSKMEVDINGDIRLDKKLDSFTVQNNSIIRFRGQRIDGLSNLSISDSSTFLLPLASSTPKFYLDQTSTLKVFNKSSFSVYDLVVRSAIPTLSIEVIDEARLQLNELLFDDSGLEDNFVEFSLKSEGSSEVNIKTVNFEGTWGGNSLINISSPVSMIGDVDSSINIDDVFSYSDKFIYNFSAVTIAIKNFNVGNLWQAKRSEDFNGETNITIDHLLFSNDQNDDSTDTSDLLLTDLSLLLKKLSFDNSKTVNMELLSSSLQVNDITCSQCTNLNITGNNTTDLKIIKADFNVLALSLQIQNIKSVSIDNLSLNGLVDIDSSDVSLEVLSGDYFIRMNSSVLNINQASSFTTFNPIFVDDQSSFIIKGSNLYVWDLDNLGGSQVIAANNLGSVDNSGSLSFFGRSKINSLNNDTDGTLVLHGQNSITSFINSGYSDIYGSTQVGEFTNNNGIMRFNVSTESSGNLLINKVNDISVDNENIIFRVIDVHVLKPGRGNEYTLLQTSQGPISSLNEQLLDYAVYEPYFLILECEEGKEFCLEFNNEIDDVNGKRLYTTVIRTTKYAEILAGLLTPTLNSIASIIDQIVDEDMVNNDIHDIINGLDFNSGLQPDDIFLAHTNGEYLGNKSDLIYLVENIAKLRPVHNEVFLLDSYFDHTRNLHVQRIHNEKYYGLDDINLWFSGHTSFGNLDTADNIVGYGNFNVVGQMGVVVGLDKNIDFGASGSLGWGNILSDLKSYEMDKLILGVAAHITYSSTILDKYTTFSLQGSYSANHYSTKRTINFLDTEFVIYNRFITSKSKQLVEGKSVDLSISTTLDQNWIVQASYGLYNHEMGGYQELGSSADLAVEGSSVNAHDFGLGLKFVDDVIIVDPFDHKELMLINPSIAFYAKYKSYNISDTNFTFKSLAQYEMFSEAYNYSGFYGDLYTSIDVIRDKWHFNFTYGTIFSFTNYVNHFISFGASYEF